jgi:hypothetical protein
MQLDDKKTTHFNNGQWESVEEGKYGGNIMYSVMKIEKCSNYSKNVCRRDKGE